MFLLRLCRSFLCYDRWISGMQVIRISRAPMFTTLIQVGINGSIVANAGFVDRMGKINSEGVKALPAVTLTTWGNVFAVGQIIGLTGMSLCVSRSV